MRFQAEIERASFAAGGGNYFTCSEASRFLKERPSKGEFKSTYTGVTPARLDKVLPEFIVRTLQGALMSTIKKCMVTLLMRLLLQALSRRHRPYSDDTYQGA